MTTKHNDATHNRPGGERIIDAPGVFVDIHSFVKQIKTEEAWRKSDRNSITVFKTDDMCIVVGGLHRGVEMTHNADGIMTIQVLEGLLDVITGELSVTLEKGQMVAIHKDCPYRMLATEEVMYLLTITNTH
jgi:quercetin dioxygenase-like cupin family protein